MSWIRQNKLKKLFFILFTLCFAQVTSSKGDIVRYDTTGAEVKKATPQKEKEVFADKDFIYHADAKESKNWLEAFNEWLSEQFFGKVTSQNVEVTWQIVKWTAIGLFVFGVVFILWKSKFRGFLRSDPKKLAGTSFTDLPEDIESVDIDKKIEEAIRNGNYRLAIRWCFLKSLQLLDQKQQIAWQPSKTNIDYQYELKSPELRERFSKLSYVFEYVWYGELSTNQATFDKYKGEVDKFNGSIRG